MCGSSRFLLSILVCVFCLHPLNLLLCAEDSDQPVVSNHNNPIEVKMRRLKTTELFDPIWFAGTLKPHAAYEITSEKNGTLMKLRVAVGDTVVKGQVVAELRSLDLGLKTRPYLIRAAESGIISSLNADLGTLIKAGQVIYKIEDRSKFQLDIFASYLDTLAINKGDDMLVYLAPASDYESIVSAKVLFLSQEADPRNGFFRIRLAFQCEKQQQVERCFKLAKSGSYVKALQRKNYREAIVINRSEFVKPNQSVLVVDDNSRAREVEVKVGTVQSGTFEITEGLKRGDRIITSYKLKPNAGDKVQIIEEAKVENTNLPEKVVGS